MTSEETKVLGRRALLAAGAAGVAAVAAQAVAPPGVRAIEVPVLLGVENTTTTVTTVKNTSGEGLKGFSPVHDGVVGGSESKIHSGVYGYTNSGNGYGVYGKNWASGCVGSLGSGSHGVLGLATDGEGVGGHSSKNNGIEGSTDSSDRSGVYGYSTNKDGYGVYGENRSSGAWGSLGYGSYGLGVEGKATFSRSGVLTIPKNAQYAKVADVALTAASFVIATPNQYRSGVWIAAAVPNIASDSITIYLNKKATQATKVAWFVLEKFPA